MIHQDSLTLEWLRSVGTSQKITDIALLEKAVRALILLEGLVESGIPFIFKGGTALMLMLDSARRLSIDIDIVMDQERDLNKELQQIALSRQFGRVELQQRMNTSIIRKRHYKFFYKPIYAGGGAEQYVLLDVVFEPSAYQDVREIPIISQFVTIFEEPSQVRVPSIEDLLADKMTAFAPNTIGIKYRTLNGLDRGMEILKQLYDIGSLFDRAQNVSTIATTFDRIATVQIGYCGIEATSMTVIADIITTALHLSTRGKEGNGDFEVLLAGIKRVDSFIFSESYHLGRAFIDAGKAAYLASIVKSGSAVIERFTSPEQLVNLKLHDTLTNKLNKLKRTSMESFFYWCKASELLT
jgi:transcription antitermination factor NusG